MVALAAESPRVLHALPGRMRVKLSGWMAQNGHVVEPRLRTMPGIRRAEANNLTGNLLIEFDPAVMDQRSILNVIESTPQEEMPRPERRPARRKSVHGTMRHEKSTGHMQRARVPVPVMESAPSVASEIENRLQKIPHVTARASHLTGRVLVEYDERETDLEDILSTIEEVEVPDLPDVDDPTYPLDPAPLIHGAVRTAGVAVGLSIILARRLITQQQGPILQQGAATVADTVNIMRGIPIIRHGLRRVFGKEPTDIGLTVLGGVSLSLSGSVQGLILSGVEGFRLLTEVLQRRETWERYLAAEAESAAIRPGAHYRPEPGDRIPYPSTIISGSGTAVGPDADLIMLEPGIHLPPGCTVQGGPFNVRIRVAHDFEAQPRAAPDRPSLYDRYLKISGPTSIAIAAAAGLIARSPTSAFNMLVLMNARTAMIGDEMASIGASARVLRSGAIVVGSRPGRTLKAVDSLIVDGARSLTSGFELGSTFPLTNEFGIEQIHQIASRVSNVCGSPWGRVFPAELLDVEDEGRFDNSCASARIGGHSWTLQLAAPDDASTAVQRFRDRGEIVLILARQNPTPREIALLTLRPRLASGARELKSHCDRNNIHLLLSVMEDASVARGIASRVGMEVAEGRTALELVRERQERGDYVAVLSDHIDSAAAFSIADLAIGIISRQPLFPARADVLVPGVQTVVSILDAGRRRNLAVRDSVLLSLASNVAGVAIGLRRSPNTLVAGNIIYYAAMSAIALGWLRLRGGRRAEISAGQLREPNPERWGRLSLEKVFEATKSSARGLSTAEAATRYQPRQEHSRQNPLVSSMLEQLRSPLVGIMAAGALLSLSFGAAADVVIIGATIATNVAIGAWQERRADRASAALAQMGAPDAEVLRDNTVIRVPASRLVPGDILLLSAGRRVAADARVIESENLEVSEAALTGESLPQFKTTNGNAIGSRILLEGSDVISGTGRAVAVATGRDTKMGALAAALDQREAQDNPLNMRLMSMLNLALPVAGAAGLVVVLSGFLRQRSLAMPLALGSSVAIAAVPEGLPLLARMGEAAVGQRLTGRRAVVRRLTAIEALGRVDVACVDKTGTLTTGQLEVREIDDLARQTSFPGPLSERGVEILRTAALASPPPDDANLSAHATDDSVVRAAILAGINGEIEVRRQEDFPFGSERSYHASRVNGTVFFKGAPEVLLPLCSRVRRDGTEQTLDELGQSELLDRAQEMAGRGLRVLAVAQGLNGTVLNDPRDLIALGFVGIADPLRADVQQAVTRCQQAGVSVIMLTGDHPATARTIGREAGLRVDQNSVLIGSELATLDDAELDRRMARTSVVARATPIDKLRIIESLRRLGHTVAMTGDGVNDAPALRLADVGVAMGRGTEVARQASDIVLLNEDFSTLVEALVEGRGFWHNIRRAVSLLLGGNLGELGLIAGVSVLGLGAPLNTRQILAVNMITDVLPALAIALQPPRERQLSRLSREGESSLEQPLRREIVRRGLATAVPSLVAYVIAGRGATAGSAATVAFSSIVATQFAQTLQAGWAEGSLSKPVLGAIGVSTGVLAAALALPPLRTFLGLMPLSPYGILLVSAAALASAVLARISLPELNGGTNGSAAPVLSAL
jgi:cation-transporting ATPase I